MTLQISRIWKCVRRNIFAHDLSICLAAFHFRRAAQTVNTQWHTHTHRHPHAFPHIMPKTSEGRTTNPHLATLNEIKCSELLMVSKQNSLPIILEIKWRWRKVDWEENAATSCEENGVLYYSLSKGCATNVKSSYMMCLRWTNTRSPGIDPNVTVQLNGWGFQH